MRYKIYIQDMFIGTRSGNAKKIYKELKRQYGPRKRIQLVPVR